MYACVSFVILEFFYSLVMLPTNRNQIMSYYSARLLIVCIVDDGKPINKHTCDYPFVIFRAKNEDEAFDRALKLGREQETVYKNEEGKDVRWALVEVQEIWKLGDDVDGIEVGSIMDVWETENPVPYDSNFEPQEKLPIFSGRP